jgi:hypothetical protein
MTRRIDPSRRHGPFDPRYAARGRRARPALTTRRIETKERILFIATPERLGERHDRVLRAAVQAWEGEGGAAR